LALDGLIVIEAIGGAVTVTAAEPDFPPLDASIVVLPTATAVTTPVTASTLATAGFLDDHDTLGFDTVPPIASTTVALSVPVLPCASDSVDGLTDTDCTGAAVTVMADVPLATPLVAEMVAVPTARADTTPDCETVATRGSLVLHVTGLFVTTTPFASVTVAVSVVA
jgi:hypothetical protein